MKSNNTTTIKDAQKLVKDFVCRNKWKDFPNIDKFDHLHEELIAMSQHLRYKSKKECAKFVKENKEIFIDGVGDLFFGLCRLANQLDVDVEDAFNFASNHILKKYKNAGKERNIVNKDPKHIT
jgi:hypothetical protein